MCDSFYPALFKTQLLHHIETKLKNFKNYAKLFFE